MPATANAVPSRPAPPPPPLAKSQKSSVQAPKPAPRSSKTGTLSLGAVSLVSLGSAKITRDVASRKKAAPPRPPPPRVQASMSQPSLLPKISNNLQQSADLLIDWNSPPGSPTAGRSSSDGISLRSFGSDSSSGVGSSKTSTGLISRSESGFDSECESSGETLGLAKPFSMPTIIRPSRSKASITSSSSGNISQVPAASASIQDLIGLDYNAPAEVLEVRPVFALGPDDWEAPDYSPPEPNMPPPALPVDYEESREVNEKSGKAVALYTYESSEAGDLNFKEGDEILVLRQVNSEWLHGTCFRREGIFPANFVRILSAVPSSSLPYRAVAKYAFRAETHEDLHLKEGDVVEVTRCLGNGWLFGSSGSLQGQFPESFVERLS